MVCCDTGGSPWAVYQVGVFGLRGACDLNICKVNTEEVFDCRTVIYSEF